MKVPFLKSGDKIKIVAPAKGIEAALVFDAKTFLEKQGFVVELGAYCIGQYNYFSGTDEERIKDFQDALDDPEIKAILCARGGYGSIRIIDLLNWSSFIRAPKWIVGFSDITVFHQKIQKFGFESMHATMPLNFKTNSPEALKTLTNSLLGKLDSIQIPNNSTNLLGKAAGKLVGGNLSILYSLLGTDDQLNYQDSILFIEDLSEQLYHIDRMFYAFQKAGIINQIKGLIVGGFTDLKDTEMPFGKDINELILEHFSYRNIPIVFDFPAGHIDDNRALVLGTEVELNVEEGGVNLRYQ